MHCTVTASSALWASVVCWTFLLCSSSSARFHAAVTRSSAPQFESICNIVEVLDELKESFDEWQKNDTATLKAEKDRYMGLKKEKEKGMRKAKDTLTESKEDLESETTESKDLDVQVESTKKGLMAVKAEIKGLKDTLRAKRQEYRDKEASLSNSASLMQAALAEEIGTMRQETTDVTRLRAMSSELQTAPQMSLLARQTNKALSWSSGGISKLQKKPAKFQEQSGQLKKEYRNEEVAMEKLIEAKQKDAKSLMDDLERLQSEYGEKQEETALLQRDIQNNQRTSDRDAKVLGAISTEFEAKQANLKAFLLSRTKIIQNLGAAIGALQGSGCSVPASFAEIGAEAVPQRQQQNARKGIPLWQSRPAAPVVQELPAPEGLSFLQVSTDQADMAQMGALVQMGAAQSAVDPFADVKSKITQLVDALKQKINADMGQQDFCDNEESKTNADHDAKKEELDVLRATIRQLKTALMKSTDDEKFAQNEISRLAAEIQRLQSGRNLDMSKLMTMKKEHELAGQVLDQSIEILRKFYNVPAAGATGDKAQAGVTGQALVDILLDTKKMVLALTAQLDSGDAKIGTLAQTVLADSTAAKAAREKERDDLVTAKSEQASNLADAEGDEKLKVGAITGLVQYKAELKEQCGPQKVDPDARAKARQEEILSLQDALKVLAGEDIPLGGAAASAASFLALPAPPSALSAALAEGAGGAEAGALAKMQNSLRAAASQENDWQGQLRGLIQ